MPGVLVVAPPRGKRCLTRHYLLSREGHSLRRCRRQTPVELFRRAKSDDDRIFEYTQRDRCRDAQCGAVAGYAARVSTQIAIRLPDELVEHLDDQVRRGAAGTRTELIRTLLTQELRRADKEAERAVLALRWDDPDDLAGLAAWAARRPLPLED